MGFSLVFTRIAANDVVDADREGLAAFLGAHDLRLAPSNDAVHHLTGTAGLLAFDGHRTDLHLDSLVQEEPVSGGIWHATLSQQECAFIYGLCAAGKMLIVNPQGPPILVVPGSNHDAGDLPEDMLGDTAWVNTPEELQLVLSGGFEQFLRYRAQIVGDLTRDDK